MAPSAAVCLTGLERSFSHIRYNVRFSIEVLLGSRDTDGRLVRELTDVADFFGVRPRSDTWSNVDATLPPLKSVALQARCTPQNSSLPPFFAYYSRSGVPGGSSNRISHTHTWEGSLCDQAVCESQVAAEELRRAKEYHTMVFLRLDLAWEVPPRPVTLLPGTVHVPSMNQKAGYCDKFAFGHRLAMRAYLTRLYHIPVGTTIYSDRSGWNEKGTRTYNFECNRQHREEAPWSHANRPTSSSFRIFSRAAAAAPTDVLVCSPHFWGEDRSTNQTSNQTSNQAQVALRAKVKWQEDARRELAGLFAVGSHEVVSRSTDPVTRVAQKYAAVEARATALQATLPNTTKRFFKMSSEAFLKWALWRQGVAVAFETAWMFCKVTLGPGGVNGSTPRTCVKRMAEERKCASLSCKASAVDCDCLDVPCVYSGQNNQTFRIPSCQDVQGIQLSLNPRPLGGKVGAAVETETSAGS